MFWRFGLVVLVVAAYVWFFLLGAPVLVQRAYRDRSSRSSPTATPRACTHKSRRADQARLVSAMASTAALKRTPLVVRVGPDSDSCNAAKSHQICGSRSAGGVVHEIKSGYASRRGAVL